MLADTSIRAKMLLWQAHLYLVATTFDVYWMEEKHPTFSKEAQERVREKISEYYIEKLQSKQSANGDLMVNIIKATLIVFKQENKKKK